MNTVLKKFGVAWLAVLCGLTVQAAVVLNDGTSTAGLLRYANQTGGEGVGNLIAPLAGGFLQASQDGGFADFPLRNAWYVRDRFPTNGFYKLSADFMPGGFVAERRGGVVGWINLTNSTAIALQVKPADPNSGFQLSVVNFAALDGSSNDTVDNLFNLDGSSATADYLSAWSELTTNYVATRFATFELEFKAVTSAELSLVPGANAHIIAKVYQSPDGVAAPVQIGRTIEVLTTLPIPAADKHRVGYYAYWGSIRDQGSLIGYLDNLQITGQLGTAGNVLPTVQLTVLQPTNDLVALRHLPSPSDLQFGLSATDSDGAIQKIELFSNKTNLLGSVTAESGTIDLINVPTGRYEVTAIATDDAGGTRTSTPPIVIIIDTPPTVSLLTPKDGDKFSGTSPVVVLTSTVGDIDGTVVRVDYFQEKNLVASSTTPENNFQGTWSTTVRGNFNFTAVAYDDLGNSSTSAPVKITIDSNIAPTVKILTPNATNSMVYTAPATIPFTFEAADSDGSVDHLELYEGASTNKLAVIPGAGPLSVTLSNVPAGQHDYYAIAIDNLGARAQSATVSVVVAGNQAPVVAYLSPKFNAVYEPPATLTVKLAVADSDGTIDRVVLTLNTNQTYTLRGTTFEVLLSNLAAGAYHLSAVAYDNFGMPSLPANLDFSVTKSVPVTFPTLKIASGVSNLINVTWTDTNSGYSLQRRPEGGTWFPAPGTPRPNGLYSETVIATNKSLYFRLIKIP